jgi:SAM-dependent methyltransferase
VSLADARHWDRRWADREPPRVDRTALPAPFDAFADRFPRAGRAVELACGTGAAAVWLARRGMTVHGYDVSPVAVQQARALADAAGCADRCHVEVADLDDGLPPGDPADVLLCNGFRDPALYPAMAARVTPGGLLAVGVLSVVGANPAASDRFRAPVGELAAAFAGLTVLERGESRGRAWLLARAPG